MRLCFKSLGLEITRKCNMKCPHCMRGDAQDLIMEDEVLEELFKSTGYIEHLVLTGGEPSLAASVICEINRLALKYDCRIGHFFCATNAKKYNPFFSTAMNSFYKICENPEKCMLTITTDQFHEPYSMEAVRQYRTLPFYNPVNEKEEISKTSVINRGNAKINGIGFFNIEVPEYVFDILVENGSCIISDRIYISTLGDVLLDPDLSYVEQKKHSIGNLLKDGLEVILFGKMFSVLNRLKGYIYKMTVAAEEGTIGSEGTIDERYYMSFKKALFSFNNFVSNLQMTPTAEPEEVRLKVETTLNQNFNENEQWPAQAVIGYYTLSGYHIGDVVVTLEFIKMEDENG